MLSLCIQPLYQYLIALTDVTSGMVVFGEELRYGKLVGDTIILLGVYLARRQQNGIQSSQSLGEWPGREHRLLATGVEAEEETGMTEERGERATDTPNTIYDLSSVLFHALEGGASYGQYIQDAEEAGDEELAAFFIQVRDEDSMRAEDAQRMIAERTSAAGWAEGTGTSMAEEAAGGVSSGMDPSSILPGAEELPPTRAGEAPPQTEGGSPRTELISASPGEEDVPLRRMEEVAPPRPEPSDDFPGTGPVKGEDPRERTGEGPPPPEEVPPERAGEIPMAEEIPPPRTEEVPMAEEVPSGTPPQAPPGDVQKGPSASPGTGEALRGEERAGQEGEEDKGLVDKAKDYLRGEDRER